MPLARGDVGAPIGGFGLDDVSFRVVLCGDFPNPNAVVPVVVDNLHRKGLSCRSVLVLELETECFKVCDEGGFRGGC